jgi:5-methylcytosine-specific restriction protein A
VKRGRCAVHRRASDHARGNAGARGYDAAWRRKRAIVIARDPVCTICHQRPSTDADHIVPRAQGGSDALENLRGACHACHSQKTVRTDGGFGRPVVPTTQHVRNF